MGYYTRFSGSVSGPAELMAEFQKAAEQGVQFSDYDLPLSDFLLSDELGYDTMKWYSWKEDVKALSLDYPALLFEIEGEGEESGDIWKAYVRNGNLVMVQARIVFDEPEDLDAMLPTPDIAQMLKEKAKARVEELDAKIDELAAERNRYAAEYDDLSV